jgi:soluble lytic murein transglycosylase-like protein
MALNLEDLAAFGYAFTTNGGILTAAMLTELLAAFEANVALYAPPPARTTNLPSSSSPGYTIDAAAAWRPLIAAYFPASEVDYALAVVWCESSGNPTAYNTSSGASGLFQHLPKYWSARSSKAGVPGADIMDPTANVLVAAWLVRTSLDAGLDPWHHWTCKS